MGIRVAAVIAAVGCLTWSIAAADQPPRAAGDSPGRDESQQVDVAKPSKPVPARPSRGAGGTKGTFPSESLDVDGVKREYRLVVPDSVDLEKPAPLVFAFHGFLLDSKDFMPRYTRLAELAADKGFLIVFPQGLDRRWELRLKDNRDVEFFDALLKRIESRYNVDRNRIYATGMSNGGYFSNVLASQRSETIAAIAPHSSGMGVLGFTGINAKRKYPVLVIHGDADNVVRVSEGRTSRDLYEEEKHKVEYLEIKGLYHIWGTKFGVNATIWEFFEKHPMDGDA